MKLFVAVTDNAWYRFLARHPELEEVNFWQPSGTRVFRALSPGEPFLFKLHAPENAIAGGGFLLHTTILPVSLAWEAFGQGNGAATFAELRQRIAARRRRSDPREDFQIGCIILRDLFFWDPRDWIAPPRDFSSNIVVGKTYDISSGTGRALWEAVRTRLAAAEGVSDTRDEGSILVPGMGTRRLGQAAFRVVVTDAYDRPCAVTRERALPALEASHIRPVAQGGKHRVDNGLLLRADIHALFDRGYVTVTPDYRFRASRRLKRDFHNGESYLALTGTELQLPRNREDWPNREFLEWHADTVFLG
jgi:putative restriction endonuclease